MIEKVDARIVEWIASVAPGVPVSLEPPPPATLQPLSGGERAIHLYLFALAPAPPARSVKRAPLQMKLCYLVTVRATPTADAHKILGDLAFAALEAEELDVDLTPLPAETWASFGAPPQPSFVLRALLRRDLPEQPVARVMHRLVARAVQIQPGSSSIGDVKPPR